MKPKRITTLRQLYRLAQQRRSVRLSHRWHPAAFVLHWYGFRIYQEMERGMYEYQPEHPRRLRNQNT